MLALTVHKIRTNLTIIFKNSKGKATKSNPTHNHAKLNFILSLVHPVGIAKVAIWN